LIVYTLASQHRDPKKPFPKISEFLPLPTDPKENKADKEEGDRLYEKLQQFKKGKFYKR
jgi:hypothetical protein